MHDPLLPGRPLRVVVWVGLALMGAVLIRAVRYGYAWSQLTAIGSIPWGQVVFVDLYLGFALFSAWIVWRETAGHVAALWIVALLAVGNLVSCIYVLRALAQGRHDGQRFWHGHRAVAASAHRGAHAP